MSSTKRLSLELYAQVFNLFNHTNLGSFAGVQTSPFFGHATSAQLPHRMELGMRFNFQQAAEKLNSRDERREFWSAVA
jgi:hypothetical protein